MADDLQLDVGTGGQYAHTKERTSTKHNQVVELNVGGASEVLLGAAAAAAMADNLGNPTTTIWGSAGLLWDGSQWVRAKGSAAGGQWAQGPAAHDSPVAGNPLLLGAYAKATAPTDVSADGDVVALWATKAGSQHTTVDNSSIAGSAGSPNAGVLSVQGISAMTPLQVGQNVANAIQWSNYSNEYTSAQTSADLVAASGSMKFYIGRILISTGYVASAVTCTVKVYFGTGAYSAGTSKIVAAAEFSTIPGTGLVAYPGLVIGNGAAPFCISAASDALKITTVAATHPRIYVSVDYIRV